MKEKLVLNFFIYLIISIMLSFGLAIALVEKGNEYPIKKFKDLLRKILKRCISEEFSNVLECTTCTIFWCSFFSDLILMGISIIFFGSFYFFWPLSGFIAMGISWFIIEFLNALDNNRDFSEDMENEDK